jgi:two-component system, chemotaxis family, chemotaxis protein CheY
MDEIKRFIIVDDDEFSNRICVVLLKMLYPNTEIKSFIEPENALSFLKEDFALTSICNKTILLLDVNMPSMTGWEFLDEFKYFREEIRNNVSVFILSSSVDENDMEKTKKYGCLEFISKPPTTQSIANAVELAKKRPCC